MFNNIFRNYDGFLSVNQWPECTILWLVSILGTVSRHKDSCKYSWDLARTARGQVQAE